MKKIIILLLCLFACFITSARAQDSKYDVTVWYSGLHAQDQTFRTLLTDTLKQKRPELNITIRQFQTPTALYNALTAPNAVLPDIAVIDAAWQKQLMEMGKIIPVDDIIGPAVRSVVKMDTYKPVWSACTDKEGKLLTLPYLVKNDVLLYNPDLLSAAGIKKAPANWTQIIDTATALSNASTNGFYVPLDATNQEMAKFYHSFVLQAAGPAYDMEKDGLTGFAAEKALFYVNDLINTFKLSNNTEKLNSAMFVGNIEDVFNARDKGIKLDAVKWAVTKKTGSGLDVTSIAIMKKNKDTASAWSAAYFLIEFPQMSKMTVNMPAFPANKQVTLSREYFEYLEANPVLRTFLSFIDRDFPAPSFTKYESVMDSTGKIVKEVLNKKESVSNGVTRLMAVTNKEINPAVEPKAGSGKNAFLENYLKKPTPQTAVKKEPVTPPTAPAKPTEAKQSKPEDKVTGTKITEPVKPQTPAGKVTEPVKPQTPAGKVTEPAKPQTPAVKVTEPIKPQTPAGKVTEPAKPQTPAVKVTEPAKPQTPAVKVTEKTTETDKPSLTTEKETTTETVQTTETVKKQVITIPKVSTETDKKIETIKP